MFTYLKIEIDEIQKISTGKLTIGGADMQDIRINSQKNDKIGYTPKNPLFNNNLREKDSL